MFEFRNEWWAKKFVEMKFKYEYGSVICETLNIW